MKPANDMLFQLIRRMTKSEKRYFKLYATRNSKSAKNNYLQLFEAIDKQKTYDEEALKKKFREASFIRYFSTAKNQLKNQILDALHEYHNNLPSEQIKRMTHQVQILISKGFFDDARKLHEKAKQKVYTSGLFHLLPEMLFIERESFNRLHSPGKDAVDAVHQESQTINALLEDQSLQWHTILSLYQVYNKNVKVRKEEDLLRINQTVNPIISNMPDDRNPVAQIYHHRAMARYHAMLNEHQTSLGYLKKALDLFHTRPALIETSLMLYINLYHNYLIPCHNLGYEEEFLKGIADLESLIKMPRCGLLEAAHIFVYTSNAKMLHHWQKRDFAPCLPIAREMEAGIMQYREMLAMHRILALFDTLSSVFIVHERYNDALTWINATLDERRTNVLQGFTSIARIKSILVHFEMGNFMLLENILVSSRRYLETRGRLFKAEKIFLSYFRKVLNTPKAGQASHFLRLKEELLELKTDTFERQIFYYFEFIPWIDSKIQGISFKESLEIAESS